MSALVKLRRRRGDPGRALARLACGVFALLGVLPLVLALVVRLPWAREKTAALVQREVKAAVGLTARFGLQIELLPPAVVLTGLQIDGREGPPAITVEQARVAPRIFSLLGGRLNVGDIEINRPQARLVIAGGQVSNLPLVLPPSKPQQGGGELDLRRPPLRSLALEEARLQLELVDQGVKLELNDLDLDLALGGGAADVSLQLGEGRVHLRRVVEGKEATDDDAVCGLQARLHYDNGELLVRRLTVAARADDDEAPGAGPSCQGEAAAEAAVEVGLSRVRVREGPGALPVASGQLRLSAPLRLLQRYVPSAPSFTGQVGLLIDVNFAGRPELPEAKGTLLARDVMVDRKRLVVRKLDAKLETTAKEIKIPEGKAEYADGEVTLRNVVAKPLMPGVPVSVSEVEFKGVLFPALMRDTGITPHTLVKWTLERGVFTNFGGLAFDPAKGGPSLMGDIAVDTEDFEMSNLAWDDPKRRRMIGVKKARVKGKFGVEPYGVLFRQMTADFGHSRLDVPVVTVGFEERLDVRISPGTKIDLADITPVASLQVGGKLEVKGAVCCTQSDPKVEGDLKGTGLQMAGLPLADTAVAHAFFKPFILELTKVTGNKGASSYTSERIRVDFDRPQGLLVEGNVATKKMDFRDLLAIFQFEKDPRYAEIYGTGDGQAHLRFEVGGPNDPCDTGVIALRARTTMDTMSLYGERYDGGEADLDFTWFDRSALERGIEADIRSLTLRKGRGVISGAGAMRRGAVMTGHFTAQDVPLSRIDAMGDLGRAVDGSVSAAGKLGGTVESPEIDATVRMSPVRIGQKVLPPSSMSLRLVPTPRPPPPDNARRTARCKEIIPRNFDLKEYHRDDIKGVYHTDGELFGGQLKLHDVQTTWQRSKRVSGEISAHRFDLGALMQLSPSFALSERPPTGELSGRTIIERMDLDHLEKSAARFFVEKMEMRQGASRLRLKVPRGASSVEGNVEDDTLSLGRVGFEVSAGAGVGADVEVAGRVSKLTTDRLLDLDVKLAPIEIGALLEGVPKIESASGMLEGSVAIQGRAEAPVARGELRLKNGAIAVQGAPVALDELDVVARVDEQELRIVQAFAKAGGGQIQLNARAPLRGLTVGELSAQLEARGVRLPLSEGVEMVASASLGMTWAPPSATGPRRRARLTGAVTVENFLYTRPIGVAADLDALARRGKRTEVVVYDPEEDLVDVAVRISSPRPFLFRNNLLEADVSLESSLLLTGTNQRFGLQGQLRVNPGGRLRLRANEFDIRQGTIRFDDPLRIAPHVDLQASTEYRRVSTSAGAGAPGAPTGAGTSAAGGIWRILMHAYGDADNLKLDLTSDPNLAQEDIVLLLTIGMTRAELDQIQAANLGSAAALEALSALAGADRAVKTVIPIIDDFRFGSAYSPRTGRTEPTVTVGKRLTDRIRANVVTGLSENRDVRSNVEWRITPGTSILGNYDNLSDVASRGLGNLGADFRVRLEFLCTVVRGLGGRGLRALALPGLDFTG